jgi:hypothetical protein
LPAGFASALPAIAAKHTQIIAAARAVFQTLSIGSLPYLFSGGDRPVVAKYLVQLPPFDEVSAVAEMVDPIQDVGRFGWLASSEKMGAWRGRA